MSQFHSAQRNQGFYFFVINHNRYSYLKKTRACSQFSQEWTRIYVQRYQEARRENIDTLPGIGKPTVMKDTLSQAAGTSNRTVECINGDSVDNYSDADNPNSLGRIFNSLKKATPDNRLFAASDRNFSPFLPGNPIHITSASPIVDCIKAANIQFLQSVSVTT